MVRRNWYQRVPLARRATSVAALKPIHTDETWNVGKVWVSPNAGPKQQEEIAVIAAALLQYTSMLGAQEL